MINTRITLDGTSTRFIVSSPTSATTITPTAGEAWIEVSEIPQVLFLDRGATGPQGAPGAPGVGVPAGGSAGQVLEKASGTDYDTAWVTPSGGAGITELTGDATAGPGSGSQAVTVVQARGLRETSGPTTLAVGAIADGEYARRVGATLVGGTPSGGITELDTDVLAGPGSGSQSATVVGLRGVVIATSASAPSDGDVLTYDSVNGWEAVPPASGGLDDRAVKIRVLALS